MDKGSTKILFVNVEERALKSIDKIPAQKNTEILRAANVKEAFDLIKKENIAVLVSDPFLSENQDINFLQKVENSSPDTLNILLVDNADITAAMDAVNQQKVFQFLVQRSDEKNLLESIEEGILCYNTMVALRKADDSHLLSLAEGIELKDAYTRGHCDRVARNAHIISEALSLPDTMKREIQRGSWLHDCGKIRVPEKILNYFGSLDEKKFALVKKHPLWGADMARRAHLSEVVENIILYHHERYDGKGYPHERKGKDIPLEARIVSVADVYDAVTIDRPYRKGKTREEALGMMLLMKETFFDPEIVDIFIACIKENE